MNFRQFLQEMTSKSIEEVPKQYKTKISIEQVKKYAIEHCRDYLKNDDAPLIFRGMSGKDTYLLDTTHTIRKSAHTNNAYTLILDQFLPSEYPRRSQSIICTGDKQKALNYGEVFVILPFNGTKIGSVNKRDIWDVFYSNTNNIRAFTKLFNELDEFNIDIKIETYDDVIEALQELCKFDLSELSFFTKEDVERADDGDNPSYEYINKNLKEVFSVKNLEFDAFTPKNLNNHKFDGAEYWIGGKSLAIPLQVWKEIGSDVMSEL